MKNDKLRPVQPGDPITAEGFNELQKAIQQPQLLTGGFISAGQLVTRPQVGVFNYKLINCVDETDIRIVANELERYVNKIARVDGKCYQIKYLSDEDECNVGECVLIDGIVENCSDCQSGNYCYKFTPCTTGAVWYGKGEWGEYINKVIMWTDGLCYTVDTSAECSTAFDADPAAIEGSWETCDGCGFCAALKNCWTDEVIYVRMDRIGEYPHNLVGRVLLVNGVCHEVLSILDCPEEPQEMNPTTGPYFDDCADCGCHHFRLCSPGDEEKKVSSATWTPTKGGGIFPLGSLQVGDVVIAGSSESSLFCWEYLGTTQECDPIDTLEVWYVRPVDEEQDQCACCVGWKLNRCEPNETDVVWTHADLCKYYDFVDQKMKSNVVLKWANGVDPLKDGWCFDKMLRVDINDPGATWEEFIVDSQHETCAHCENPKYKLVDAKCKKEICDEYCEGCDEPGGEDPDCESKDPVITDEDLADVVGQIIKYDGVCWDVEETDEAVTDPAPISWQGPFASCEPCLEEPMCIEVVENVWVDSATDEIKKRVKKYVVNAVLCADKEEVIEEIGDCT